MSPSTRWLNRPTQISGGDSDRYAISKRFGAVGVSAYLLGLGDGFGDVIDGLKLGFAGGAVSVDQDGEDEETSAGSGEIAGECVDAGHGAGFGPEFGLERRVGESGNESAVDASDGEGFAKVVAP